MTGEQLYRKQAKEKGIFTRWEHLSRGAKKLFHNQAKVAKETFKQAAAEVLAVHGELLEKLAKHDTSPKTMSGVQNPSTHVFTNVQTDKQSPEAIAADPSPSPSAPFSIEGGAVHAHNCDHVKDKRRWCNCGVVEANKGTHLAHKGLVS